MKSNKFFFILFIVLNTYVNAKLCKVWVPITMSNYTIIVPSYGKQIYDEDCNEAVFLKSRREENLDGDGIIDETTIYTYDSRGNMLSFYTTYKEPSDINTMGMEGSKYTYTYDNNNNKLSTILYWKRDDIFVAETKEYNTYDSYGNVIKSVEINAYDNTYNSVWIATYDSNGNRLTFKSDNYSEDEKSSYIYGYDNHNNVILEIYEGNIQFFDDNYYKSIFEYEYDIKGRIITKIKRSYDREDNILEGYGYNYRNRYSYDYMGNIIKYDTYEVTPPYSFIAMKHSKYEYDTNGNIVLHKSLDTDGNTNHYTAYTYDIYNNLISEYSSVFGSTTYTWIFQ